MITRCPNCKKRYVPALAKQDSDKVNAWIGARKEGTAQLIQKEWPDSTTDEREQLLTGMCSDKCWKEFLGPEE